MDNAKAVWAFLTALLALAVLIGAAAAARMLSQVGLVEAVPAFAGLSYQLLGDTGHPLTAAAVAR